MISTPKPQVNLSKRELEVLSLVSQGYKNQDIANTLFLSKRTVDFHISSLFSKLGVNNRVKAGHVAAQLGIFAFEPRLFSFGVQQNAVEDFVREMTEAVIPEIIRVVEERRKLASQSRQMLLQVGG